MAAIVEPVEAHAKGRNVRGRSPVLPSLVVVGSVFASSIVMANPVAQRQDVAAPAASPNAATVRAPAPRAEEPGHPPGLLLAEDPALSLPLLKVEYDAATDRLAVSARHSLLSQVLNEISGKTQVPITSIRSELLREEVSVEIPGVALEEVLRRLLRGFNSVFLYSAGTSTGGRLARVVVISKKEGAVSAAPATRQEPEPFRADAMAQDHDMVKLLLTVEAPVRSEDADFPTYRRAVDTLRRVAPDLLVDPLVRTLLQNTDPEIRVYAATILGHLADHRAVDALARAFLQDGDSLARQVAMYSLIRIGGEMALGPVFQAFKGGAIELQQAIALALARKGDEQVREAFTKLLADPRVSPEVLTVWQLADSRRLEGPPAGATR